MEQSKSERHCPYADIVRTPNYPSDDALISTVRFSWRLHGGRSILDLVEQWLQPFIGPIEQLRHNPCAIEDRYETRVAIPAWNNLDMQVFRQACASSLPDVDAHIETAGIQILLQNMQCYLRHFHEFAKAVCRQQVKIGYMHIGHDKQVSVIIGIEIHNHITLFRAMEYIRFPIIFIRTCIAQEAVCLILRVVYNVSHPPRRPESVHVF
jgi:hypothetical protein